MVHNFKTFGRSAKIEMSMETLKIEKTEKRVREQKKTVVYEYDISSVKSFNYLKR